MIRGLPPTLQRAVDRIVWAIAGRGIERQMAAGMKAALGAMPKKTVTYHIEATGDPRTGEPNITVHTKVRAS